MSKPTVPEVLPFIQEYYRKPENCVGGNLHIVLEDSNVEDIHVKYCLKQAKAEHDKDGVRIAELLLQMSKTQRRKLGLLHGYPALGY